MFPAEEKIGEVKAALAANKDVILAAPPGSGKTTCIPPALVDEPWLEGRKIVMLEPRRLAARNCAIYIASQRGETVGETIGYQVRLERKVSSRTRLEIVTEGLLAQRFLSDPELADTGLVIFDEFHERSLACDLAFALALDVRRALRPDLRIMVMSATLDAAELAAHLDAPEVIRAEGRMFPVETKYLGGVSMAAAIGKALGETDGDILCFLPGEGEIMRTLAAIPPKAGVDVLPLYGALPKNEQDRVFESAGGRRKVILSTSIAETSVTIPGITCVIDSGLMRVSRFTPSTGMSGLVTMPLTLDRAEQRRGRAGRVRPGVCYRLWEESGEAARGKKMTPEILDADLCPLVLSSAAFGACERLSLPWLTPPAASAWDQASGLLKELGALDASGRLTPKGETMAAIPMHPRLANMLLGSPDPATASILAAIIEEKGFARETDIRRIMDEVKETPGRPYSRRILELARRFARMAGNPANVRQKYLSEGAMLAFAYPDRIAKNRGNGTFRMVSGRGAMLEREDALAKSPYIVCCNLDDRLGDARVFLCAPIGEDEIFALFGENVREEGVCEWDKREERVRCAKRKLLGAMLLEEVPSPEDAKTRQEDVWNALAQGIRAKGVENLPNWTKSSLQLRERLRFLSRHLGWNDPDDEAVIAHMEGFAQGIMRWKDLEKVDMCAVLECFLSDAGHDRRELERLAPERMEVPTGSHMLIHYDGAEPTVEVRLQECFGLMETPKLAGGKVPIVMTLLSPAHRPIQITKDLAGFWREGYALVRKDMRGRYPKHYWPEEPFTAVATRKTAAGTRK